jgi:FAD binding domain
MAQPDNIARIVHPYLTHEGSRYSLKAPVQYPSDCIKILRSRPCTFSAQSCNKWALDRVILVGDAAHVFPPFGGQGITPGFRDASVLAWRLTLHCRNNDDLGKATVNHRRVFETWRAETAAGTLTGCDSRERRVCDRKEPFQGHDQRLESVGTTFVAELEEVVRERGTTGWHGEVRLQTGDGLYAGIVWWVSSPQVCCLPLCEAGKRCEKPRVVFTDDVIFAPHKQGRLQVVVLLDKVEDVADAVQAINDADKLSNGYVIAQEATFIVHNLCADMDESGLVDGSQSIVRLATGEEFAAADGLCPGRPKPKYYDMYRMQQETGGRKFVIVRPDFFVFAAARNGTEATRALKAMAAVLEHR